MIICPNAGDECDKLIRYIPKSAFLIISYPKKNEKGYKEITEIEKRIEMILEKNDFSLEIAKKKLSPRSMLCKICEYIQATSFSIAIYTSGTPNRSIPNIFYEIGIAQAFGKSVYLINDEHTKRPSDLIGLEWVTIEKISDLDQKFDDIFNGLKDFFELNIMWGDYNFDAKNYEIAFWYYKNAYLLNPTLETKNKILEINKRLRSLSENSEIRMLLQREIDSITKFITFMKEK